MATQIEGSALGWWKTRCGVFARIDRENSKQLEGTIFKGDGEPLFNAEWDISYDSFISRDYDLVERQSGDNLLQRGWPEWTLHDII